MALTNPYCQVADVRSQLGDDGDKLDQALIERAINAASRAVDRWCGRRFWQDLAAAVRLYAADDPFTLSVADISTMDGLLVEVDQSASGTWTALDAADYHLEPLNADADGDAFAWWTLVVDNRRGLPISRRPLVRVTAQWGWSAIPDDVVEATIIKAVNLFKRKDAPFGVAGFADFGAVRIGRSDPDVVDLLRSFRRPVVA